MSFAEGPPGVRVPRIVKRERPPFPAAFIDTEQFPGPKRLTNRPREVSRIQPSAAITVFEASGQQTPQEKPY